MYVRLSFASFERVFSMALKRFLPRGDLIYVAFGHVHLRSLEQPVDSRVELGEVLSDDPDLDGIRDAARVLVLVLLMVFGHVVAVQFDDLVAILNGDKLKSVLLESDLYLGSPKTEMKRHVKPNVPAQLDGVERGFGICEVSVEKLPVSVGQGLLVEDAGFFYRPPPVL